jgi:hypothetical protein
MEKLQKVLKYQFWILLAVALILPLVGWYMATGGMATEALARTKSLQDLSNSLKVDNNDPNGEWQRQLGTINAEQETQAAIAWRTLFERQKPFMVWPGYIDDPAKIEEFQAETYRERYADELEKVHQIVKPADERWQNGLVRVPDDLFPPLQDEWKLHPPSQTQIEAAQEDLWLLAAILNCIASVNEDSLTPFDAPVREITDLSLRGGTKGGTGSGAGTQPKSGGTVGGAAAAASMPAGMDMAKVSPAGARSGAGNVAGGDSGGRGMADVTIKVDEVLGPERPASAAKPADKPASGGQGAGGVQGVGGAAMPAGADMMKAASPVGAGDSRRVSSSNMDRYRDDEKEFKTRGFSLQVVMDLRRVPDLLVELSNCEGWPINILRVHEADYKDEDLVIVDDGGAGGQGDFTPRTMAPGGAGIRPPAATALGRRTMSRPQDEDGGDEEGPVNTRSPLEDPNLARVAIVGLIYIFKTPPEAPAAAPSATQETPAAPVAATGAGPAAASDAPPAVADAPKSEADEADEKPEASADSDDKGPDASDPADSKTDEPKSPEPKSGGSP